MQHHRIESKVFFFVCFRPSLSREAASATANGGEGPTLPSQVNEMSIFFFSRAYPVPLYSSVLFDWLRLER